MVGPNGGQGKAKGGGGGGGGGQGEETQGCLPLAAAELFRKIANIEAGGGVGAEGVAETAVGIGEGAAAISCSAFEVCATYLEVYKESVYDLLAPTATATATATTTNGTPASRRILKLREGPTTIYAEGAVEERVKSVAALLKVVARGSNARSTAATGTHEHSSRSHAVLVLTVEHRWQTTDAYDDGGGGGGVEGGGAHRSWSGSGSGSGSGRGSGSCWAAFVQVAYGATDVGGSGRLRVHEEVAQRKC
jgi:hypothetical protein